MACSVLAACSCPSMLLCILFSRPETRKTACTGRFESYGYQPIMLKITAWLVGRWICEWRRQPRKRLRLDLELSLGPDSSRTALVIVADGTVLGTDDGGDQHMRKVAAMKSSDAVTLYLHSTIQQTHSTHNSVDLGEHHHFLQLQSSHKQSTSVNGYVYKYMRR